MFGNWVCFDFDDFTASEFSRRTGADTCLQLFDAGFVDLHRSSTNGYVVVFGEYPGVEVGRNVVTDIHFCQVVVICHLIFRQTDALLESDRIIIIPCINFLGNAGICPICTDNCIHF